MDKPDPTNYWGRLLQRLDLGSPEHMVLLDVGMVAELTAEDQSNLVDFFKVRASAREANLYVLGLPFIACDQLKGL